MLCWSRLLKGLRSATYPVSLSRPYFPCDWIQAQYEQHWTERITLRQSFLKTYCRRHLFVLGRSLWATILVFQPLASFSITLANHMGNLCRVNISDNQPWSTESYALATSIHPMLRFRFPLWASSQTIRSISKFSTVPVQLPLAPRCSPCINPYVSRYWLAWANRHVVYHLYRLFRQVIGRWLSLLNSPGLGIRVVLPSENHKGNWRSSSWAVAWKQVAISLRQIVAFFNQTLALRSGPGALQFFFLLMIYQSVLPVLRLPLPL